ncbi:MAG: 30S ribosomal protein S6 [Butyrivibrio sp.]|nr:30S ribosomal protein S6 [Butyrivibrio sp.]
MSKYELALVLNAKVDDEARTSTVDKAKALIERFGGQITDVEEWGKKRLAYEIDKMTEGYYTFLHFEAETTAPAEIERRVRILDGVIRYLVVKDDGVQPKPEEAPAPEEKEEKEEENE